MSAPFVTRSWTSRKAASLVPSGAGSFPKTRRLLKPGEFRNVYNQGFKMASSCFVAFCWRNTGEETEVQGPRVGFTTPRALGKAVLRNRMRRRLREVVRSRLVRLDPAWRIVWNLRRGAL